MYEQHLPHDQFFNQLTDLFGARKGSDHGAVYLTQKRLTYGSEIINNGPVSTIAQDTAVSTVAQDTTAADFADTNPAIKPMPVIVRATNGKSKRATSGKKIKLSTIVQPHQLESFYSRYAEVCKAGMLALKPRDRSKKKAKAKKKKTAA